MRFDGLKVKLPEDLVRDFASDPLAPFDKLLKKASDSAWLLYTELSECLGSVPPEAIEAVYEDRTFVGLYGKTERLARIWIAEHLLIEEAARRRLDILAAPSSPVNAMPYAADCLRAVRVDSEGMVQSADFAYNNAVLAANRFSFTVCSTTDCASASAATRFSRLDLTRSSRTARPSLRFFAPPPAAAR